MLSPLIDTSEMQAIIRDYCEQLYVSELGNLEANKHSEPDNLLD